MLPTRPALSPALERVLRYVAASAPSDPADLDDVIEFLDQCGDEKLALIFQLPLKELRSKQRLAPLQTTVIHDELTELELKLCLALPSGAIPDSAELWLTDILPAGRSRRPMPANLPA